MIGFMTIMRYSLSLFPAGGRSARPRENQERKLYGELRERRSRSDRKETEGYYLADSRLTGGISVSASVDSHCYCPDGVCLPVGNSAQAQGRLGLVRWYDYSIGQSYPAPAPQRQSHDRHQKQRRHGWVDGSKQGAAR